MLWALADQEMPTTVRERDDVDAIEILVMAGHVQAEFAPAVPTAAGWVHPAAKVKKITRLGRQMLRSFPPDPADPQTARPWRVVRMRPGAGLQDPSNGDVVG